MLEGARSDVWTAMPGEIISFDSHAMTCSVQITLTIPVRGADGTQSLRTIPPLVDCPVQFPSGGQGSLTFPVAPDDECLVVFASRCIDSWWQSSGVQAPAEKRMHDLSDGFVLLGVRSRPRALPGISTSSVQLRSDDGTAYIDLNPSTGAVKIVAPGGFSVEAPESKFSADVTVSGLLTWLGGVAGSAADGIAATISGTMKLVGELWTNGKRVDETHTHRGVQSGGDVSGDVS